MKKMTQLFAPWRKAIFLLLLRPPLDNRTAFYGIMTNKTAASHGDIDVSQKYFEKDQKKLLTLHLAVMIYLACKEETALFLPLQNREERKMLCIRSVNYQSCATYRSKPYDITTPRDCLCRTGSTSLQGIGTIQLQS